MLDCDEHGVNDGSLLEVDLIRTPVSLIHEYADHECM
jgi:hypothetical protein